MNKVEIKFTHALRSIVLLVGIFVSNNVGAVQTLLVEYGTGFERVTHLRNDGQSYFALSEAVTKLNLGYGIKSGKNYVYAKYNRTAVNYKSGESVVLNTKETFNNSGYSLGYQRGLFKSFHFELGQSTQTFITKVDGFNMTLEALKMNYLQIGGKSYLYVGSSVGLNLEGHIKHYTPGSGGSENPDFVINRGTNWGGSLNLEIGKWNQKGGLFQMYMKLDQEQFESSDSTQNRTDINFGMSVTFQF